MSKRSLTKVRLCKKYGDDIWGDFIRSGKIKRINLRAKFNEALKKVRRRRLDGYFALRVDIIDPQVRVKRKTAYGRIFLMKQKLKYFYGFVKEYQFKNIYTSYMYKKIRRFRYDQFIGFYETRLDVILYRAGFVKSPMQARYYINNGYVLVNGKTMYKPNFCLVPQDIISIKAQFMSNVWSKIRSDLLKKFMRKYTYKHLEINYQTGRAILLFFPNINELRFPFKFDYKKFFNVYNYR